MLKKLVTLVIVSSAGIASALPLSSELKPITRDGVTKNMLVYSTWSGEYPIPVVDVKSRNPGTTTLQAEASFERLGQKKSCTVENGLIHPWSQSDESVVRYFSVAENRLYRVLQPMELMWDDGPGDYKSVRAEAGEFLTNVYYLGEGFLLGDLEDRNLKLKAANVSLDVSLLGDNSKVVELTAPGKQRATEQWVELMCTEGGTAYMRDTDLLSVQGVQEGQIIDWGGVAPAPGDIEIPEPTEALGM